MWAWDLFNINGSIRIPLDFGIEIKFIWGKHTYCLSLIDFRSKTLYLYRKLVFYFWFGWCASKKSNCGSFSEKDLKSRISEGEIQSHCTYASSSCKFFLFLYISLRVLQEKLQQVTQESWRSNYIGSTKQYVADKIQSLLN